MDVTCDRCKTRYEFDAALVSSRGTTVKCTTCGHQFRVFRPEGAGGLSGWTVRRRDGSELRFLAMRELQSAIASAAVDEHDLLVPDDGSKPQRLGTIEELRSFFKQDAARHDEADTTKRKLRGVGPMPAPQPQPVLPMEPARSPTGATRAAAGKQVVPPTLRAPLPAPKVGKAPPPRPLDDIDTRETNPKLPRVDLEDMSLGTTAIGHAPPSQRPQPATLAPPAIQPARRAEVDEDVEDALQRVSAAIRESTPPRDSDPDLRPSTPDDAPRSTSAPAAEQLPAPRTTADARASEAPPATRERPSVVRRSSGADPRFSEFGRRSSAAPGFGRWALGLVAIGLAGLLGYGVLRKLGDGKAAGAVVTSDKVAKLVEEGDVLLADGEVDGARELFAKASGASEHDPGPLRALARVALVVADRSWLRGKIEVKEPEDLGKLVERARVATEAAVASGTDESANALLKIELLRLQGKVTEARQLVTKVNSSDRAAGRVLAMLELAEPEPSWDRTLERLRAAAGSEGKLGQAQAALVFALHRHGDADAAKRELDKLAERAPEHPLLSALRDLLGRAPTAAPTGSASAAPSSAPVEPDMDFREALKLARTAQKRGQHEEADKLYRFVLQKDPGNSEAQTGLAEVARAKGDTSAAETRYKELLKDNPNFVPGLVGMADLKWQRGDKAGALELYRQVVADAPGTAYAEHAQQRLREGAGKSSEGKSSEGKSAEGKSAEGKTGKEPGKAGGSHEPPPPPPPSHPEIDTTDLPE